MSDFIDTESFSYSFFIFLGICLNIYFFIPQFQFFNSIFENINKWIFIIAVFLILVGSSPLIRAKFQFHLIPNVLATSRLRRLFCIHGTKSKLMAYIWSGVFITILCVGFLLLLLCGSYVCFKVVFFFI